MEQPEVGLIMELILSDGNEHQKNQQSCFKEAVEEFYNSDNEVLEEFTNTARKLGLSVYEASRPKAHRRLGECSKLTTSSILSYLLLRRYDEFIVKALIEVQLAFLRGLWLRDGDENGERFYNSDLRLIATVEELLEAYGVEYSRYGPYKPSKTPRTLLSTDRARPKPLTPHANTY